MIQKRIALVTCWFGSYPWYFPYFIHSCKYNPSIDFIIFTENKKLIPSQPKNVKIINLTIDKIRKDFSKKLDFPIVINNSYKLCDFKPAYGYLFSDVLEKYDFWGMGDIDIVYGNIRAFMTDTILNEYDIISSRHDYITGSFCLFKNTEYINRLFMKSKDYKKVFTSSENFCFDECNYQFDELAEGKSIFELENKIESMTYIVRKEEQEKRLKAFFDFIVIEGCPGKVTWDMGKIVYKREFEAMLYHLVRFKNVCKEKKVLNPIPDSFHFTPTRIKK